MSVDVPGGPQFRELMLSRLFARETSPPRVGRFTLLQLLGEGGMGVVYAAYDEDLDRRVAIKLLRAGAAPGRDVQRARMLREAKLMAQLSHPNVITVHEVGEHDGQVFIAMEFIRGESLDQWRQRSERPDWRAVISLFAQAGAGLVAAHRAGLVHRDFKPQNVMVSQDGVVKVLDFGLACEVAQDGPRRSSQEDPETPQQPAAAPLTRTGAVMGTPAYMAPEQHLGQPADERSDQFSFCVALYESIYGQHPFAGRTLFALQAAVLAGQVREPPANSPVPARVRRLLVRGLAVRPEDRHASLAELLAALTHDPATVRRRWLAVGGLVLAASTGSYVLASRGAAPATLPCSGVEDELAAVWNDERSAAVAAAISATGVSYAEETWTRIEPALATYARDWTTMRAQSCQAHVDALESDRHYDLRTACLARRRTALDALVSILAEATPADVERAAQATSALAPLAACADTDALAAALAPPDDPAVARAVEEHRGTLARASEYEALGRYAEARALVGRVIASAEASGYPPLAAEASLALGSIELAATHYEDATAALSDALVTSLRAGHLDVAAEAFTRRIFTQGQSGKASEALQDVPLARALVDHADDDQLRWLLLNNIGALYYALRRFAEAQEQWLAALAAKEQVSGRDHFEYALALTNLGASAIALGDIRGAREYQVRGLDVAERVLGAEHPMVAQRRFNLASSDHYSGRFDEAHARMTVAVAAMARAYGADAEVLFNCFLQLAALSNDRGAHAEALGFIDQAARVRAAHHFEDHPNLLYLFVHRAVALAGLGRHDEAMAELRAGLTFAEERRNPVQDPAEIHEAVGRISLAHGDAEAALQAFRQTLTLRQAASDGAPALLAFAELRVATALQATGDLTAAHALAAGALARFLGSPQRHYFLMVAELRLGLGDILLAMGRPAEAIEQYETAHHDLATTCEPHNPVLAALEFGIARALVGRPADRPRAEALARGALASLRRAAPGFKAQAEAVERLLRGEFENSSAGSN